MFDKGGSSDSIKIWNGPFLRSHFVDYKALLFNPPAPKKGNREESPGSRLPNARRSTWPRYRCRFSFNFSVRNLTRNGLWAERLNSISASKSVDPAGILRFTKFSRRMSTSPRASLIVAHRNVARSIPFGHLSFDCCQFYCTSFYAEHFSQTNFGRFYLLP